MEYVFQLELDLPPKDRTYAMGRLAQVGCTDVLVGRCSTNHHLHLKFIRNAELPLAALLEAQDEVKKTFPNARLLQSSWPARRV